MTASLGRVAVLAGGLSHEREISLESGEAALAALRSTGVDARVYDSDSSVFDRLIEDGVSVVYNALHGTGGEDGTIQEALEFLDIPFVGSTSAACRRAWDKATARANIESLGLAVPRWCGLSGSRMRDIGPQRLIDGLRERLGFPMVVKPGAGGSAQGLSVVDDDSALRDAIIRALGYGETLVFEEAIPGREFSVIVYEGESGLRELHPVELLLDGSERFDYDARHDPGKLAYGKGTGLSAHEDGAVRAAARTAHVGLGLRDISRADFVVGLDGVPVLLEVSLSPGLSWSSSIAAALSYSDETLGGLLLGLVEHRYREWSTISPSAT